MTDARTVSHDREAIWDAMEKLGTPFLVTNGRMGPHARPMSPIFRKADGLIWFLTRSDRENEEEILANPQASLAFGDGSVNYVTLVGTASVVADPAVIADLWNAGAEAYFPDGKTDPQSRAIRFQPIEAEFWDGPSKPIALLKMAGALLTGSSSDDKDDHKIVPMR